MENCYNRNMLTFLKDNLTVSLLSTKLAAA